MKKLIGGGLLALAVGVCLAPVAGAEPNDCADPKGACHEFDWAMPIYDAFERHGLSYLLDRESIPLANAVDWWCSGEHTDYMDDYVSPQEKQRIIAADICAELS
jgi:hypothetical protein